MGTIEKAIEEFSNRQRKVYCSDPDRIRRDTKSAERAAKDHVGRWFFELFQNSDDAEAGEVLVIVNPSAIYIADNGTGLKPEAVKSICGTDLSDKTAGTIGRKGVGFKAVYEISDKPQVFTVNSEGIEFSCEKTREWLSTNKFPCEDIPFQWIPFFVSRSEAEHNDPVLNELQLYKTVIKLPLLFPDRLEKAGETLSWYNHALLAFRNVGKLEVRSNESNSITPYTLKVERNGEIWCVEDSRDGSACWRVEKHCELPPEESLVELSDDDKKRTMKDNISFLVAAPLDDNSHVNPTDSYLPVHVFYPTEQNGPIRLFLHAEFLVKSDRTELIPIETSAFNQWVADRLASHICDFVQNAYNPEKPSGNLALLVPMKERESHPCSKALWERIAKTARECLRLGNVDGEQCLTVDEAKMLSVSVRTDLARQLLEATEFRSVLLHRAFDEDKEACKALQTLECAKINDEDVIQVIKEYSQAKVQNHDWVWTCWEWIAAWVASEKYGEEHTKRINQVNSIPIIPVNGRLCTAEDLDGHIVTWRTDAQEKTLPDWLPLTFIEDWFRDRVSLLVAGDMPIANLLKELRISEPSEDVVQRAVGEAITQYWKTPEGEPGRFLCYIAEQNWYETAKAKEAILQCPVPTVLEGGNKLSWTKKAKTTYFGKEWGNDLLAVLYNENTAVSWVQPMDSTMSLESQRDILAWLGVAEFPRVIKSTQGQDKEKQRVYEEISYCVYSDSVLPQVLEHLEIAQLNSIQAASLIRLLTKYWESYYQRHITESINYKRHRSVCYHTYSSAWWDAVQNHLQIPQKSRDAQTKLAVCWLPDKRTERTIGELLPIIDLSVFGDNREAVDKWLREVVKVRERIDQVSIQQWKKLLSEDIPSFVPAEKAADDERLRDKVTCWYETCIDALAERSDVLEGGFKSCPLLCRKGGTWEYITNEQHRYIADDTECSTAFRDDVWLLDISSNKRDSAKKFFMIPALSDSVKFEIMPEEPHQQLDGDLKTTFNETLPYLFVWRSTQTKQDKENFRNRLKSISVKIVPTLIVNLTLNNITRTVEQRSFAVSKNLLFIRQEKVNESVLAKALAEVVDVRSEAAFYENLLRCNGDIARKEKLLDNGLTESEVDRLLREYNATPSSDGSEGGNTPVQTLTEESGQILGKTDNPTTTSVQSAAAPTERGKSVGPSKPITQPPSKPGLEVSEPTTTTPQEHEPLRLKDPNTDEYEIGTAITESRGGGGGWGGGGGGSEGYTITLPKEESDRIEMCGRLFAQRELVKLGYLVEPKPQENPGFDLLATKDREELRVEVKAHLGKATIVDNLTVRQYKEYLLSKMGNMGYKWELWNVENLRDGGTKVIITRYVEIPEESLDVKIYKVDLSQCTPKNNP